MEETKTKEEFYKELSILTKDKLTKEEEEHFLQTFENSTHDDTEAIKSDKPLGKYLEENLDKYANVKTEKDFNNLITHLDRIANNFKNPITKNSFYYYKLAIDTILIHRKLKRKEKALEKKEKALDKREKKGKYKRSGHLQDQLLKYSYPKDNQPNLFSQLQEDTLKQIEVRNVERGYNGGPKEGIKLTPSENKVIDCLCKLLHNNSQTLDSTKTDFYTGNREAEIVEYGDAKDTAPKLALTLYELTKEYVGEEKKISGKEINNLKNILVGLSQKDFLIRYTETIHHKGGKKVREIEMVRKILSLPILRETDYSKEGIEISKKEETLVILHPIFKRQIDSKFILYPEDIHQRTILAYGSSKVSNITLSLRDYLMRELSSKHYTPEITLDRLYYLVAERFMRESRKGKVKKDLEKALEVVKKLGLLESYKITTAKTTGEPKVVFKLNKDFE